jgi:hypothetical protein
MNSKTLKKKKQKYAKHIESNDNNDKKIVFKGTQCCVFHVSSGGAYDAKIKAQFVI